MLLSQHWSSACPIDHEACHVANNFHTISSHDLALTHTIMLNDSLNTDVPSTWASSEHAQ